MTKIQPLKIPAHFSYMYSIIKSIYDGNDTAYEYHFAGSRESGKTYNIAIVLSLCLAVALKYEKTIGLYGFRWQNTDVKPLQEEFDGVLSKMGIRDHLDYTFGSYKPKYKFKRIYKNDSFLQIIGIHTTRTDKIALKGLTSLTNHSVAVIFIEEANEFSKLEMEAIRFAIRGNKKTRLIFMTACNPEHISNSHIKYLDDHLPFDLYQLKTKYQQLKVIKEPKSNLIKVFHYANWRLNPHISQLSKQKMLDLEVRDPEQALVWSYGMIGNKQDSVFARYLKQADKPLEFIPAYYTAGLDLGVSDSPTAHPTSASFWCMDDDKKKLYKLNEWFHNNLTEGYMRRPKVLESIIFFYYYEMKKWKVQYLTIQVDYGNGGAWAVDLLSNMVRVLKSTNRMTDNINMKFVCVKKEMYYLKDRIDFTTTGIVNGWIGFNFTRCPNTKQQYGLMKYKTPNEQSKNVYELIDKYDDCWDSDFYAWCPVLKAMINNNNIPNDMAYKKRNWIRDWLQ